VTPSVNLWKAPVYYFNISDERRHIVFMDDFKRNCVMVIVSLIRFVLIKKYTTMKTIKTLSTICVVLANTIILHAQDKPVAVGIIEEERNENSFREINLVRVTDVPEPMLSNIQGELTDETRVFFTLNDRDVDDLLSNKYEFIRVTFPFGSAPGTTVDLRIQNIFADDFYVETSEREIITSLPGLHYGGIIRGDANSLVALSIYNGEIAGFISSESFTGNMALGKLQQDNPQNIHILYNDLSLAHPLTFDCEIPNGLSTDATYGQSNITSAVNVGCVNIWEEVNYDIFQHYGTVAATNTYITNLFNQVKMLYANENIAIKLAQIYIWTTTSPYTGTDKSTLLGQFVTNRTSINNCKVAQLLGTKGGGGLAHLGGNFCTLPLSLHMSYCDVDFGSSNNVPTFEAILYMAHEMGHNFGAQHTHACVWNGNFTAIDNCNIYWGSSTAGGPITSSCSGGFAFPLGTEGGCPNGPSPGSGGGTIMSYCHGCSNIGINFSNGFGQQPGSVLRTTVTNSSSCLSSTAPSFSVDIAAHPGHCDYVLKANAYSTNITSYLWKYKKTTTWYTYTTAISQCNACLLMWNSTYTYDVTATNECGATTRRTGILNTPPPCTQLRLSNEPGSDYMANETFIAYNYDNTCSLVINNPVEDYYTIDLFDIKGAWIKSLAQNRKFNADENIFVFSIEDILPGMYFCRLTSNLVSSSIKLIK